MSEDATLDEFADSRQTETNQEVPPPTELTGVTDGWAKVRLAEVAESDDGAFVDGPFGSNLKADEMHSEGYARIIQLQNIRESEFVDTNHRYISEEKFEELRRHGAEAGDLAIAKMSEPVARACLLPDIEDQYLVVADCIKLSVDESGHNSQFVMLALNSRPVWKQAFARSRGSTRKRINLTQLKEVQIPSPPLSEQRKIGTVLHTVDQAIQKTGEIIERIKRLEQGLMQDLFRRGVEQSETKELRRVGEIPRHWQIINLGDVCTEITDGTHKSPPTIDDGYPYVTSQNVRDWGFDLTDLKYISKEDHERITSRCNPEANDVLYVKDGANTGNVNVNTLDFEFSLLSSVALIKPDRDRLKPWFLKYLLSWSKFRQLVLSQMSGTGISRLTISKLEKTDILLPPIEEQERIVEVLDAYYEHQKNQREYRDQLKSLKQGLMQDLLSGKVRTTDVDIDIPEKVAKYG